MTSLIKGVHVHDLDAKTNAFEKVASQAISKILPNSCQKKTSMTLVFVMSHCQKSKQEQTPFLPCREKKRFLLELAVVGTLPRQASLSEEAEHFLFEFSKVI